MSTLFSGLAPDAIALALLLATSGFLLLVVGLSRLVFLRMSLRNMIRRPSQTVILLCGLMLSTIFITASLGLSDSFTGSEKMYRLAQLGQVDEAVSGHFSVDQFAAAIARLKQQPGVRATAGILLLRHGADVTNARTSLTQTRLDVYGLPPAFDQAYGPVTDKQGHTVHFADLRADEIIVSATVAKIMDVRPGDTLSIQTEVGEFSSKVSNILSTDIVVTSGELLSNAPFPEILLPLAMFQQMYEQGLHQPIAPNVLCISNTTQRSSQAILRLLQQIFQVAPLDPRVHIAGTTQFDSTQIHPLRSAIVGALNEVPFTSGLALDNSPAGREYALLLPAFTWLLIGAGMVFLILLCLLLAAERRAELGISRALGLQRQHLVQLFLLEACGYGVLAALPGVSLGVGAVALELWALGHLPTVNLGPDVIASSAFHVPLHLQVSWQSLLSAGCLSVLATAGVACLAAFWISRLNIVAAIRNLDDVVVARPSLSGLLRALWQKPRDASGHPLSETLARRFTRSLETMGKLFWGLCQRGPLCLLCGLALLVSGQEWMHEGGIVLLLTGGGLLVAWAGQRVRHGPLWRALFQRLGWSWIGVSWVVYGAQVGGNALFSALASLPNTAFDSANVGQGPILLSLLLQIGGCVVLVMTNLDLLAALLSFLLKRSRRLAPLSRMSVAYPLTFRFRAQITVTLLSSITFLIMLLLTNNLGQAQQGQVQVTSGNFQLEVQLTPDEPHQLGAAIQHLPGTLPQDVAAVSQMHLLYDPVNQDGTAPQPVRLYAPGQPVQQTGTAPLSGPLVVDDTFFNLSTMPLFASAQGYTSARQVWDSVKNHPGDAVMRYDNSLRGLPTSSGFTPFSVEVPESSARSAPYHRLTIIGLLPANVHWSNILLSTSTASQITPHPSSFVTYYYLRIQPGMQTDLAISHLEQVLHTGRYGLQFMSLDAADANTLTADLTLFLVGYLASGLLFGALAISIIVSRAVVERRQQIGMLRALGFTRTLILGLFIVESTFVITVGLATGASLAIWLAAQIARQLYQNFPFPLETVALIFLGSYLVAIVCIALPARRASRIPPAEALRYE
ncbi:MAG TPA: FtsX-like permease family protein [Ktedonobacteraceae bacterium]|nr:FtsX-like permease family protein [Ktedonobacteraceae bacterium]